MPSDNGQTVQVSARRSTMIKGLIPSLPESGKIKIGIKGKMIRSRQGNEFQPPQKLDHFIVTTLQRGPDGNFIPDETLMRRLGPKPTEIPVRLLYDDPALNFPTRYACFVGRSLWCSGDGEVALRMTDSAKEFADGARPEPREVSCPCPRSDPAYDRRDKCKMNGSLSVLVEGAGGIGGVWKFRTTSYNSIVGIMSSLAFIRSVTGGVLANIPLKLRVRPKQATAPDGNQVVVYVVSLEFDGDMTDLQTIAHGIALDRAKMHISIEHIEEEAKRMLALAPPANAPLHGDEPNDIVDEFYPEQVEIERVAEPEPPRARDLAYQTEIESESETDPEYLIIDCDGEEVGYRTREKAAAALDDVFHEATRRGKDHLEAAIENNAMVMSELGIPQPDSPAGTVHPMTAQHSAASPAGDTDTPAGNGYRAKQSRNARKDASLPDGGSAAPAPAPTPAGDTISDMFTGEPRSPSSLHVDLQDETSEGWEGWRLAMWALIEAKEPPNAILAENRENLVIFEQIDQEEHGKIMRALEAKFPPSPPPDTGGLVKKGL